jgi:hypothetical protein
MLCQCPIPVVQVSEEFQHNGPMVGPTTCPGSVEPAARAQFFRGLVGLNPGSYMV